MIEQAWKSYALKTMPKNASPEMIFTVKTAFYMGAMQTLKEILNNSNTDTFKSLNDEIKEYITAGAQNPHSC